MEILLGLRQPVIHRLADEAQAQQEAFERLCDRSGVPQVLRKFPLQTKIEVKDEADLQRDLAERQLEAQINRRYSRLIDRLYQRQVLGREVVDEEEMEELEGDVLLQPVKEGQPMEVAAQSAVAPDEAPMEPVVEVPPPPPPPLDMPDVDIEAEPKPLLPVPPVKDLWLSGALSAFLAEKESQANRKGEEEVEEEQGEEEEVEEVEEVDVEAKVKRKREDLENDDEEEAAPPHKKRSRDMKERTQKEACGTPWPYHAETTTLLFYRPRPYYCAARDTEGFVWTGRSLLDEWDSTDDSPGSGFNRLWSLTRPKRLDLTKFVQACERVRNRPPSATTKKSALFLARNVRLVRESAATARLPTYPALRDAESLSDAEDESQADDDYEEKETAEEEEEEVVPKYGAPPSPPMGRRRRGVVRRKSGRTARRTPPRARVTRRAAAAASTSASPATATERRSKRATTKPSTTTAATGSSSSSSSTRSKDTTSAGRRRITPTTVAALPNTGPKAQLSSGWPMSETTAVAAPTVQPPQPLSRRTERVVEISFPLTPRTPTLRAGQNGGGSTRWRVVSRHDDEESLSDTDDPFAFPKY